MVGDQQPGAKNDSQNRRWRHDVPEQFPFHDNEAILAKLIFTHGVIDEQTGQIENPAKPANYPDDMKGFKEKLSQLSCDVLMIAGNVAKLLILRNEMLADIAI
jgi:hypothetical protein